MAGNSSGGTALRIMRGAGSGAIGGRRLAHNLVADGRDGQREHWVVSAPIRMRILSSPCHFPAKARRAPISKYPVAMSNALAIPVHSFRYRSPVQPETLLSTMKRLRPRELAAMGRHRYRRGASGNDLKSLSGMPVSRDATQ